MTLGTAPLGTEPLGTSEITTDDESPYGGATFGYGGFGGSSTNPVPLSATLSAEGMAFAELVRSRGLVPHLEAEGVLTADLFRVRSFISTGEGTGTVDGDLFRSRSITGELAAKGNIEGDIYRSRSFTGELTGRGKIRGSLFILTFTPHAAGTPIEYIEEDTFTKPVDDPEMKWIGYVTDYRSDVGTESLQYMDTDDDNVHETSSASWRENLLDHRTVSVAVDYIPTDFEFLKYFTGDVDAMSNDVPTVQFGEIDDTGRGKYRRIFGCIGQEYDISFNSLGPTHASAQFFGADFEDWSSDDYIGDGTHAEDPEDDPIEYADLGDLKYGGRSIIENVETFSISISNEYDIRRSRDSDLPTEIDSVMLTNRILEIAITFKVGDVNWIQELTQYDPPEDLTLTIGDEEFTFESVSFRTGENRHVPGVIKQTTIVSDPIRMLKKEEIPA